MFLVMSHYKAYTFPSQIEISNNTEIQERISHSYNTSMDGSLHTECSHVESATIVSGSQSGSYLSKSLEQSVGAPCLEILHSIAIDGSNCFSRRDNNVFLILPSLDPLHIELW